MICPGTDLVWLGLIEVCVEASRVNSHPGSLLDLWDKQVRTCVLWLAGFWGSLDPPHFHCFPLLIPIDNSLFHALPSSPTYYYFFGGVGYCYHDFCQWPFLFLLPLFHYTGSPQEHRGIYRMLNTSICYIHL